MDWNGDGKHDWQDDAFYLLVLDEDGNATETDGKGNSCQYDEAPSGCLPVLIIILFIVYIIAEIFS